MKGILTNALLATVMVTGLWAQASRGTITGVVRDASGAVVPGVSVTVRSEQTGSKITVKSQIDGVYLAPQILPGNYSITAAQAGFKRLDISGLKVDVSSTLTQDLTLEVGAVTETLKVSEQTSLVETASGEVGTTIAVDHVLEMPLVDRNVFNLINLLPADTLSALITPPSRSGGARSSAGSCSTLLTHLSSPGPPTHSARGISALSQAGGSRIMQFGLKVYW